MAFNPFKSGAGYVLHQYFDHVETKAWKETIEEPHIAILSWSLGEEWLINAQQDAQAYARQKDARYHCFHVELHMFCNMIGTKLNKFLDWICKV